MAMKSYGQQTRRSAYWSFSAKCVQQLFSLVVTLYVARLLGPKDFGVMALGMAIVVYLNGLTSFGMTGAMINSDDIDVRQIDALFTLNLSASALFVLLLFVFPQEIAALFNSNELAAVFPALSLIIPLSTFYNLPMALMRRNMDFKGHSLVDFFQYVAVSAVILVMAMSGFGIWSLVIAQLAGYALSAVALIVYSGWRPRLRFEMKPLEGLLEFGVWELLRYNVVYINNYASYFVVSGGISPTHLGLYDRASSFTNLPYKIMHLQFSAIMFSVFSRIKNDRERIVRVFNKSLAAYASIIFPVMSGIALVSDQFTRIFLGNEWLDMIPVLQILSLYAALKMLSGFFGNLNISCKNYKKQSMVELIQAAAKLCLCLAGLKFGMIGIAVGVVLSAFLSLAVNIHLAASHFNSTRRDFFAMLAPGLIGSAFMTAAVLLVRAAGQGGRPLPCLSLEILTGATVIVFWNLFCPFPVIREIVAEIFGDLRNSAKVGGRG